MSKKNIILTVVVIVSVLYGYRLYSRRNLRTVVDGSIEYEIDDTQTT